MQHIFVESRLTTSDHHAVTLNIANINISWGHKNLKWSPLNSVQRTQIQNVARTDVL